MSTAGRRAIHISVLSVDSRDRDKMGMVAVTLRVMPDSPKADMERIKSDIRKKVKIRIKSIEEKPVAFGLKALEILLILPDMKGGTDEIEEAIRTIKGVASVESGEVTLL